MQRDKGQSQKNIGTVGINFVFSPLIWTDMQIHSAVRLLCLTDRVNFLYSNLFLMNNV